MTVTSEPHTGRCRCEHVRFQMDAEPMITHCCHCLQCQKSSSSAFCNYSMIETTHVTLLQGKTQTFQGAKNHKEVQCAECASTLWLHRADLGDGVALIGVGMLDEPARLPPEAHYFIRSKHPWVTLPPGVPAFEAGGDAGKPGFRERIMAVLAASGARRPAS
jgi:hypothetical protein